MEYTIIVWNGYDERHTLECESYQEANEGALRIARQIAVTGRCELCNELCAGHYAEDMPETSLNTAMFDDGRRWVCVEALEYDPLARERGQEKQYWPHENADK